MDNVLEDASKRARDVIIDSLKLCIADLRDQVNKTLVRLLPKMFKGLATFDGVVNYNPHRLLVDLLASNQEVILGCTVGLRSEQLIALYKSENDVDNLPATSYKVANPYVGNRQRPPGNLQPAAAVPPAQAAPAPPAAPPATQASQASQSADGDVEMRDVGSIEVAKDAAVPFGKDKGLLCVKRRAVLAKAKGALTQCFTKPWMEYESEDDRIRREKRS